MTEADSLRCRLLDKLLNKGLDLTPDLRIFRDSLLVIEINSVTELLNRSLQ